MLLCDSEGDPNMSKPQYFGITQVWDLPSWSVFVVILNQANNIITNCPFPTVKPHVHPETNLWQTVVDNPKYVISTKPIRRTLGG